jgi:hypothetical protein
MPSADPLHVARGGLTVILLGLPAGGQRGGAGEDRVAFGVPVVVSTSASKV